MDTPEMVYADIMLELQASCREKREAKYEVESTTPLGTYEQALHASFLVRELNAFAFPILNSIINATVSLRSKTNYRYFQALHLRDWPEAGRWMHVLLPPIRLGIDRLHDDDSISKEYPIELKDFLPRAYTNALRCAFAYAAPFLRKRDWKEAHLRMDVYTFQNAEIHAEKMALEFADLGDTGGPHDGDRTLLQDWERIVKPYLDREPAPRPEAYYTILELGSKLSDATPLHPALFRAALFATHPKAANTRLGALPPPILHAILRWARWSKRRQSSLTASMF
jgi:hypothetical protein